MADTARPTLYKTRLTEHVHAEQLTVFKHKEKQNTVIGSFRTFYQN